MNAQITQQNREDVAQQLRQWAMTRNVSLAQIEQMVMAVFSGQYDAQLLQANSATQPSAQVHQRYQEQTFTNTTPIFGFQTPFGTFPLPTMPAPSIPAAPNLYPPPATVVPDMFPTAQVQAAPLEPQVHSMRTTFPGGEAIQQSSSYSGHQGNTTFKYSSSSTSMNFTPGAQIPTQLAPLPSIQYAQQSALPAIPQTLHVPAPAYVEVPTQPPAQRPLESYAQPQLQTLQHQPQIVRPQAVQPQPVHMPVVEVVPTPDPIFYHTTADQAPQNTRLANKFKQQLTEATYFSDIPGMPDRSVQR